MKQTQSSRSAEGVALLRSIEAERPAAERLCDDPYAHALIPGGLAFALSRLVIVSGLYERMAPGATTFVALRERYIDDFLTERLAEGLDQVVILGAGFDTRAYRLPGIAAARVFEVDHPATQAVKRARLRRVVDPLPGHVSFVPVDFNSESLDARMREGGYAERGRTLFIWQGVTYFLTAEGVDRTLAFIAGRSGPGSAVIFDYFYSETLRDERRGDARMLRRAARLSGEAYMFGIDQGQVGPFLARRGFADVRDATMAELGRRYLTGPNARRTLPSGMAIASARVGGGGG